MTMDGRHKDVEGSSSCSRNCVDAIERQSVGMGLGVHKTKKFFSLRRKTANSGQCGQKINYQTHSNLVYDTHHRPQCDIDNQNSHSCDYRHGVNWTRTPCN